LNYEYHPAAQAFPILPDDRLNDLAEDIKKNGLREPIVLCDEKILDGRNRYMACATAGVKPRFVHFDTGDPWAYVWSLNGERRDLTADQRYLIWKECHEKSCEWQRIEYERKKEANCKRSKATKAQPRTKDGTKLASGSGTSCAATRGAEENSSRTARAYASKTNRGAVERMDRLAKKRPDLAKKVKNGEMRPGAAMRELKRDEVIEKVAELPGGKYRVLYADPPWQYGQTTHEKYGHTGRHYPAMSMAELSALDVQSLSTDEAVLFLWTTSPMLPEGLTLMSAWGFSYKASFVWNKVKHNFGNYNSVRHEFLLIGTRGSCLPDSKKLIDSVVECERSKKHSEKPELFREIIDKIYPAGPRIELFARQRASGWDAWGAEA
jgi:N6-adenosine-specific RNA methylase IME4